MSIRREGELSELSDAPGVVTVSVKWSFGSTLCQMRFQVKGLGFRRVHPGFGAITIWIVVPMRGSHGIRIYVYHVCIQDKRESWS